MVLPRLPALCLLEAWLFGRLAERSFATFTRGSPVPDSCRLGDPVCALVGKAGWALGGGHQRCSQKTGNTANNTLPMARRSAKRTSHFQFQGASRPSAQNARPPGLTHEGLLNRSQQGVELLVMVAVELQLYIDATGAGIDLLNFRDLMYTHTSSRMLRQGRQSLLLLAALGVVVAVDPHLTLYSISSVKRWCSQHFKQPTNITEDSESNNPGKPPGTDQGSQRQSNENLREGAPQAGTASQKCQRCPFTSLTTTIWNT